LIDAGIDRQPLGVQDEVVALGVSPVAAKELFDDTRVRRIVPRMRVGKIALPIDGTLRHYAASIAGVDGLTSYLNWFFRPPANELSAACGAAAVDLC
jgi:hypothetical protein